MADHDSWRKNVPEGFDGRFGDKFDAEIGLRGVIEVTVGILVACAIGMGITWYMLGSNKDEMTRSAPALAPIDQANEQKLPSGPLLQAKPEAELEALRHEMATRLHGYGWVSEASGVVHIPIEKAIDLMVSRQGGDQTGATRHDGDAMAEPVTGADGDSLAEPRGDRGGGHGGEGTGA